ncbi:DUF433 domain-containing protein [Candidatus Poribacteria bacterium]
MLDRIAIDPRVCHGKPCIKGTRIPVFVILDALAAGMTYDEISDDYPPITGDDIRAALSYAALLADEEEIALIAAHE